MHTTRARLLIAAAALAVLSFFLFVPPIAQDETYHFFADNRTVWSIPNFWNVVSNVPFAVIGILGLWKLRASFDRALFAGVLLTCCGSRPDRHSLGVGSSADDARLHGFAGDAASRA
jgi:hypothetical protein